MATIFSRHFLPLCLEFLVQLIQGHRKFSGQTGVHKNFPVPGAPGPPVPRGAHESAQATAPQLHPFLPIGLGLPRQPAAYSAYELCTATELISYLHATAGFARRYRHHLPGNKEDTSMLHRLYIYVYPFLRSIFKSLFLLLRLQADDGSLKSTTKVYCVESTSTPIPFSALYLNLYSKSIQCTTLPTTPLSYQ